MDEREDGVERQVQRISTIDPVVSQPEDVTSKAQAEISDSKPTAEDVAAQNASVSSAVSKRDETPYVHVESEEAKEARLDRQWKEIKVNVTDLPDIYARLAKVKLTGRVHGTS